MFQTIKDNGFGDTVPIAGLFSAGAFTNKLFASSPNRGTGREYSSNAVMYVIMSSDPCNPQESVEGESSSTASLPQLQGKASKILDVMTSAEKKLFDDSEDRVIVTKRDPESAVRIHRITGKCFPNIFTDLIISSIPCGWHLWTTSSRRRLLSHPMSWRA